MKIVVCVKYVPDASGDRTFEADNTTDRTGVDGLLSELDEYAVEEALKIVEAGEGEVIVADDGSRAGHRRRAQGAADGRRLGACTSWTTRSHGSDAPATSLMLAKAIEKVGDVDLVLTGMASTDGTMSVVPAMLAERLGLPQVTMASELTVDGGTVTIRRDGDAVDRDDHGLPARAGQRDRPDQRAAVPVVQGDHGGEEEAVGDLGLADLGIDAGEVGLDAAWSVVESFTARPPREAGQIVTDEGDGGAKLAEFLAVPQVRLRPAPAERHPHSKETESDG